MGSFNLKGPGDLMKCPDDDFPEIQRGDWARFKIRDWGDLWGEVTSGGPGERLESLVSDVVRSTEFQGADADPALVDAIGKEFCSIVQEAIEALPGGVADFYEWMIERGEP